MVVTIGPLKWKRVMAIIVSLFLVLILILAGAYVYLQIRTQTHGTLEGPRLQRSGPVNTFPASWTSFCNVDVKGNTTTVNSLAGVVYPDLWNTTTTVSLTEVYQRIVDSPAFMNVSSGHGWVTASWGFGERSGPVYPGYDIFGFFVLTNGTSPDGYVTAYYGILNGRVSVDYQMVMSVACSAITSS